MGSDRGVGWRYEDCAYGRRLDRTSFDVGTRRSPGAGLDGITAVADLLGGPEGLGGASLGLVDVDWRRGEGEPDGETAAGELVVVDRVPDRSGESGTVTFAVRLWDATGSPVGDGTLRWRVAVGDAERASRLDRDDPVPMRDAWSRALMEQLDGDEEFRRAAEPFDGVIGLAHARATVMLKVFEGSVLTAARRAVSGATFTIRGSEAGWLDFLTRERNEFMAMSARGAFSAEGDVIEYQRLTRAVMRVLDAARRIA